ncbi:MAG: hypothetical protein IJ361_01555 [Spirochaetaceae bacterium]|nr:hypothetical protein [Spirochaetaceae bacterium]
MKKKFLLITIILVITTLLVSCWCPVGNPWDYEDIEDNNYATGIPYPLSSGKAYHASPLLRNNIYGCGNSYKFIAESDVHCQFAVKLYQGKSGCEVKIDDKEVSNPENGFDVPEGSTLVIRVHTDYYLTSGSASSYAEFYLYVD